MYGGKRWACAAVIALRVMAATALVIYEGNGGGWQLPRACGRPRFVDVNNDGLIGTRNRTSSCNG